MSVDEEGRDCGFTRGYAASEADYCGGCLVIFTYPRWERQVIERLSLTEHGKAQG